MSDNFISKKARDWGQTNIPQPALTSYTKREKELFRALLEQVQPCGGCIMINRATLRTSGSKMQEWYYNGWVMGAGSRDERGTGNTPETSWWWLTGAGEAVARKAIEGARA
jgi:hypothetical protein